MNVSLAQGCQPVAVPSNRNWSFAGFSTSQRVDASTLNFEQEINGRVEQITSSFPQLQTESLNAKAAKSAFPVECLALLQALIRDTAVRSQDVGFVSKDGFAETAIGQAYSALQAKAATSKDLLASALLELVTVTPIKATIGDTMAGKGETIDFVRLAPIEEINKALN